MDEDLAWTLGMYVAEGYRRDRQINIANTEQDRLDRLQGTFAGLGIPVYRSEGAITVCSKLLSRVFSWMGMGGLAPTKRVPSAVYGWPTPLIEAFLAGLVDGDGSTTGGRTSVWTTSDGLVSDVLLLFARLGKRAGSHCKQTANLPLWQVYAPDNEHKLLTTVPVPNVLLRGLRAEAGLTQRDAAGRAGYKHATDLHNIEGGSGRDAIRFATVRRLAALYAEAGVDTSRLDRLVDGDLAWDRVVDVIDTGEWERIYDIEVRPSGRKVQNFLAGHGGVLVSNTAGFIDAGWDGHITLELSNVANLPITLYPGMKIGQISFLKMTTPADVPYGRGITRVEVPGPARPHAVSLLGELQGRVSSGPVVADELVAAMPSSLLLGAIEHIGDVLDQVVEVERAHHEGVGAGLERERPVSWARRAQDHAGAADPAVVMAADLIEDREARSHTAGRHVEDHAARELLVDLLDRIEVAAGARRAEAGVREEADEELARVLFVVHDQHGRRSAALLAVPLVLVPSQHRCQSSRVWSSPSRRASPASSASSRCIEMSATRTVSSAPAPFTPSSSMM